MYNLKILLAVVLAAVISFSATVQAEKLSDKYKLEKVLILSRHNIRAPLIEKNSILSEITPHKWHEWNIKAGELSLRGGLEEVSIGQYFNEYFVSEGFITENYIPAENEMRFYANSFQRTIATAQYFASGMLPVANVKIEHKFALNESDPNFIPKIPEVNEEFLRRTEDEKIKSGYKNYLAEKLSDYAAITEKVLDFKNSKYAKEKGITKFSSADFEIPKNSPYMKGEINIAKSASDALIMQYYENDNSLEAAFNHELTREDWEKIAALEYFGVDLFYDWKSWSTCLANPLLKVIRDELANSDRKFTFLCGHDTNIAMVLSALDVEDYNLPDSLEKKTPVGVKIVIEKRIGNDGKEYAALNLVYQSTEQMKTLEEMTLKNPPKIFPLKFKGLQENEDGLYLYADFERHLNKVISEYNLFVNKF